VRLDLSRCRVRDWRQEDLQSLVRYADNRHVWINLRDRFPSPYTEGAGRHFLDHIATAQPTTLWAIEVEGRAVGGIGLELHADVERVSAEIGYWLGEPFWGRGVMTDALTGVTSGAFEAFDLTRIFALPFASNAGSIRVLQKAGYQLEGRLRQSAIKDGVVRDQLMYAAYKNV
jgi:RimJ/RimL family protein N-acetyltransferase